MKKLKCSFVFIIAFLLFTSSSVNHEYYVSVTKIEYVKKEKSLQIISQIFIDDFEKLIHERYDR